MQFLIGLGLLLFSAVLTALLTKAPSQNIEQPNVISDFQLPQIAEGTPQTVVFGDVWLPGWQVLWYGNLRSTPITQQASGGKK